MEVLFVMCSSNETKRVWNVLLYDRSVTYFRTAACRSDAESDLPFQAFIIGYTSDAIPRLVYRYAYSSDTNLEGYVQFSLSEFNTKDFQNASKPAEIPSLFGPTVNYCW